MGFGRFYLLLRLPLAILVCVMLFGLYGNFPFGDNLAISGEVADTLGEIEDNKSFDKSFDVGLQGVILANSLNQHFAWISLGHIYVPQGVTFELHATGPPNA